MIPNDFIQTLLSRVDIVDVVERYVPLKKAGANLAACCPFHSEKSPSFTVSPTKQFYHCFGCGAHGTALGFLMEYDKLSFPEAIEELAGRLGLDVPREASSTPDNSGSTQPLYDLNLKVAKYFASVLPGDARAREYARKRGLTRETVERFMIGFAPGFPYLGLVDDRIATPRRAEPRVRVPAGSVGIAGRQTGIYPAETPGGWMLVGRTPLRPFDLGRDQACLFSPGDAVQFYPIKPSEYSQIAAAPAATRSGGL